MIKKKVHERVKLPEDCSPDDYDPEYYINNLLLPAILPILNVIGITKYDVLQDKEQRKLEGFI